MSFRVGEIVVNRRSKAKTLKAKIYKIAESIEDLKYRCVSPTGRSKVFRYYEVQPLEDHVRFLEQRVRMAARDEEQAQNRTLRARNNLNQFIVDQRSAGSLFKN